MGEGGEPEHGPTIDLLCALSTELWVLAVVFYGAGDLVTTVLGFQLSGVAEVGVVASIVTTYGVVGLVVLKAATLSLFAVVWLLVPAPYRIGVPLGLASLGVVVTVWNVHVLVVHFA